MSYGIRRNILCADLTTDTVAEVIRNALQQDFGQQRHATKRIARAAEASERSAENWMSGKGIPGGIHLLRLMSQSPTLAAEVRRITAMEAEQDPDTERAISAAVQAYLKVRGG